VYIGDTVRVRYLTDDKRTMQLTISRGQPDAASGIINEHSPIAQALLGGEPGEKVEVLIGRYIRRAVIEQIFKGNVKADEVSSPT
jgi:transcription elongation GreA/GreB family factor